MCGRFALTADPAELQNAFPEFIFPTQFTPRYNIAPGQPVLAIPNDGSNRADFFTWGLIPSWAKDPGIGSRMINARAETITEKPSFRGPFKYRRCIIPATGFIEWKSQAGSKSKIPHFIYLSTKEPFAFAGLWETWNSPDGSAIKTLTIITTQPNSFMEPIHNRMPVILQRNAYAQWLNQNSQIAKDLLPLLSPYHPDKMSTHTISSLINNPANDTAEVLIPA